MRDFLLEVDGREIVARAELDDGNYEVTCMEGHKEVVNDADYELSLAFVRAIDKGDEAIYSIILDILLIERIKKIMEKNHTGQELKKIIKDQNFIDFLKEATDILDFSKQCESASDLIKIHLTAAQ